MFNKQNFCHIASNNRNEVKVGVFVYKTTDSLETVLTSGYFNEKIVDINLHDIIIHEWHNPNVRTDVEYNVLCVTERTLDNVGTQVIKSKLETIIEEAIENIETDVMDGKVSKAGDTMTGALEFSNGQGSDICLKKNHSNSFKIYKKTNPELEAISLEFVNTSRLDVYPVRNEVMTLGAQANKLLKVYTTKLNNGGDLEVPAVSGTIATKAEVDSAANSGVQLTDKGVWYAKMYPATVAPSADDGTNYADFSQTDGQGNPIIVLYERQNGAWVQTDTITPPADYNGYVTVTSKIWDIAEQAGQQGGKVLWAHTTKTFTPYPQIISYNDAHLTGNSTTQMPAQPTGDTIVNVDYLSNHTGGGKSVGDIFFTTRTDSGLAGAVECNGATYNTTDFVGSGSIGGLLADGKVPYVSLADYATALATNGVCGVYGWDGAGTTAFRVPSLTDIFIETGTAAQIGDYIAPAVPNFAFSFSSATGRFNIGSATGAATLSGTGVGFYGGSDHSDFATTVSVSASNSSPVYKNTTTVQPNTVRYRAMVQLAAGATDEALETCTSVLADVAANKAAIAGADYVVENQLPTAQNNYTWYRKYKSGWVEQGGILNAPAGNTTQTVNFPVPFSNTDYVLFGSLRTTSTASSMFDGHQGASWGTKERTHFTRLTYQSEYNWRAEGMAA